MNLQQLEYVLALAKHKQFVLAAQSCGVTQPTLSTMIQKLERELDVEIFDRTKHPLEPTPLGTKIIDQAERTIIELQKIKELVLYETDSLTGELHLGVIPTIASYLIPRLIEAAKPKLDGVTLSISELNTDNLITALHKDKVDMFIAATPLNIPDFYEIPLYYEHFVAYFSPEHPKRDTPLSALTLPGENLWVLEEGHCLRDQIFNFCANSISTNQIFEAGSIDTLIRIVDKNGGYTVIPELHVEHLSPLQRNNVRKISNPPAVREVSLVIRKNFVKERIMNVIVESVKESIPTEMLDERLKKFTVRLR